MFFKEKRKTIVNEKIYNTLIDSHHQEMPPQVTPGRHLLIQDTD